MSPDPDKVIEHKPDGICPRCGMIHPEKSFELIGKRQVIDKYKSITTISISEGTVYNLLNKAANMVLPIYEGIKEEIAKSGTTGTDETGVKVTMNKFWAWTWQTIQATYIIISPGRRFATVSQTSPDGFPHSSLVRDSWAAQLKTPSKWHQLCLAHLFRELNYFQELYQIKWVTDVKDVLSRAIDLKNRMTPQHYDLPSEARSDLLDEFDRLITQELPDKYSKIFPLKKRLKKRKQQVFNFLYYPEVPYENNGSYPNFSVIQTITHSPLNYCMVA